jgi:hypothetical protein
MIQSNRAEVQMPEPYVDVEQVIGEVLDAERKADDVIDEAEQAGDAAEIDEAVACGALDGFTDDQLVPDLDDDARSAAGMVRVGNLDGVRLLYARAGAPRPQSFSIERGFRDVLVATVKSVRFRAPQGFGDLVSITSAGAYVDKPGAHGRGRAFDHDAWTFENVDIRPLRQDHAAASRARRQRYWALAAILRSRSAFVLHGEYDAAHRDHIHQDNVAATRAFTTGSEAAVKLAQAICKHIYGNTTLVIDGVFGPLSRAAARAAMIRVDLPGDIFDNSQWELFLLRSGRLGFKLSLQ